ncbi:hypothetical protein ACP4OV_011396 [Aristida adscensionis]
MAQPPPPQGPPAAGAGAGGGGPAPGPRMPPRYLEEMMVGFIFRPKGTALITHYLLPNAVYGHVHPNAMQDGVAEGVDVCAVNPSALPFPPRNRASDGSGEVWAYFFTRRPPPPPPPAAAAAAANGAAADPAPAGRVDPIGVRFVQNAGFWLQFTGPEKKYLGVDGEAVAFRRRFAFYETAENGGAPRETLWRAKEFRLNETAAVFSRVEFRPDARDLAIWLVYNEVEFSEEPEDDADDEIDYDDDDDDDDDDGSDDGDNGGGDNNNGGGSGGGDDNNGGGGGNAAVALGGWKLAAGNVICGRMASAA